jgi:hypothetical protein
MIDDVFDATRRSRFSNFVIGCDQGSNRQVRYQVPGSGTVGQKPDWLLSDFGIDPCLVMMDPPMTHAPKSTHHPPRVYPTQRWGYAKSARRALHFRHAILKAEFDGNDLAP